MSTPPSAAPPHAEPAGAPNPLLVLLLAAACGLVAANLYYAQPLLRLIAPDIGLPPAAASLIVTLTQLGYCAGLLLLVPLGDLLENRRLIVTTLGATVASLAVAAMARSAPAFLAASLAIGVSCVVVQMLVPMAAHLAPEAIRGRVVGNVMSGLLVGIMLARPVASLVADGIGWRWLFAGSAGLMLLLGGVLRAGLPLRRPEAGPRYGALLASMATLWRSTPLLRRRAIYQAALFAAFSLYWTAVPLLLTGPAFGFTQRDVAWFTLAGVAGAFAAPLAGRMADRGLSRQATLLAMLLVTGSFLLGWTGRNGSVALLLAAGIVLDVGVQINLITGQRAIYSLGASVRSRLNALFMATFFAGGAIGSALASVAFEHGGWSVVSGIGFAFGLAALLYSMGEAKQEALVA